ncbi:MAG TPA: glycosyltransferase family 4 protein [Deltaproteobacteria bacterium]|jgi:UDP-glucose:(heptosyl)LPS alpha-1,3-glucosyltransferase|nr:glycosyltransferase family 4 protein [Deltaproteobacteria bacterium]
MNIALIRQRYTDFGGAERYVAGLADRLTRLGHDIHVFAASWRISPSGGARESAHPGLTFHRVPTLRGTSFLGILSFALNSRRLLRREAFDVIHSFERTLYQDVFRAGDGCHREWLERRERIDPWFKKYLHPINPLHRTILSIESRIFSEEGCRMIIANSRRGKDEIIRHYGFPPERIRVLYNPVDAERFTRLDRPSARHDVRTALGISPADPVFLFVGSGFSRKGLSPAIAAASKIRRPWHFIVIGADRTTAYEKETARLGIRSSVHFLGPIADVEKYYLAADLFLFPTIYEPFSNACMEAMAAGLPIVTSRVNGVSEIVAEGTNGYIVEDPLNADEIRNQAEKAMSLSPESVMSYNRNYLTRFSWEDHTRQILEIYLDVAEKKRSDG